MKFKLAVIGLTLVSSFALQGCYTQLAMFYPEPEVEQEEDGQFYETYSRAPRRTNLYIYAQDSSNRTGLAYGVMQSRFDPFMDIITIITLTVILTVLVMIMGMVTILTVIIIIWVAIHFLFQLQIQKNYEHLIKSVLARTIPI